MPGVKRTIHRSQYANNRRKQAKASLTVQKLDARLRAYRRRDTEWTQYQLKTTGDPAITSKYMWHLTSIGNWVKRFGPDPGGIVYTHKIDYDLYFKSNTEAGPTTFSAFIVGLRSDTSDQLIQNNFTSAGLVENLHFISGQQGDTSGVDYTSGMVYLNPQYFVTLKSWKFTLGPKTQYEGTEVSNVFDKLQSGSGKRFCGSIPWRKRLHSGRGNFEDMTACDNNAKLFLFVFTDNLSGLDGSPTLHGHVMATVKST